MGDVKVSALPDIMRKCFKMGLFKIIPSQPSREKPRSPPVEEDPDVVSQAIGDYGRWQLLITFLLSMFSFPCTFHIYLPTFTARETKFWCQRPDNFSSLPLEDWINYSQPIDACNVRVIPSYVTVESILNHTAPLLDSFVKCTDWDFDRSEVGNTIISEWDLVCDRASLTNLAEVVFLTGVGIGGVVGGWISDKFGRKRILMGMMVAQSALAILSLLVRSYIQYVIVRLIMGLVSVSVVYAAFVLSVELVGGKWVTIAGVCNFFPLPVAYIIVSLVSLYMPNWRELQLALSLPGCVLLVLWFVLPESPRWLISMGRTQEAKVILQKAAKFNKRELPNDLDKLLMVHKAEKQDEEPSVFMLFKGILLKRTICLFLVWFAMTIAYYGLLLNIGKFNLGNLHVASIILAVVEIPAIATSIPILLKAGRRIPIFITMVACGLACVASEIFSISFDDEWIIIVCLMVGKFAIGSTNMMLPIFTAELYPTVIRNLGVGASQLSAGLALICIPYLWKLKILNDHLPMVTIAALSALGGAIVLLLPEVAGCKEPQPISDTKKPSFDSASPCNGTFTVTDDRGH
ncbi:organic cation transporter protein-like isoform X2 [Pectinophora gossypiella]|uniref:organic cation transporter protein-like isoform X2 n=1 Tax=Pectinophora gossypiella TaxID=13191 RepID=UPI00214E6D87|nr:organic cation transporter protein-like isoform X2 [Pectinophora gossypiella]